MTLVRVSTGHMLDNFQPTNWTEIIFGDDVDKLSAQLEQLKVKYETSNKNFLAYQQTRANEFFKIQQEIAQIPHKIDESSKRTASMDADITKMKEKIDIFLQVANDEKDMYGRKLDECSKGHNPTSFGNLSSLHVEPPMMTHVQLPQTEPPTTTPGLSPGVNQVTAGPKTLKHRTPTLPPRIPPHVMQPSTTPPWVSATAAPPLVEGVEWKIAMDEADGTSANKNTKCYSLLQTVEALNDGIHRLKWDRTTSLDQLDKIQKETSIIIPSADYVTRRRDDLLAQKIRLQKEAVAFSASKQARKHHHRKTSLPLVSVPRGIGRDHEFT